MDIEWIRKGLKQPEKSQRGLAAALGLDPAAVNRLLKGERQLKASEVEKVRTYLESATGVENDKFARHIQSPLGSDAAQSPLKVLGMAEGGPDGWSLWNGDVIEWVARPTNLAGVPDAYAVYVMGSSMEPRYHPGELAHIHPHKPITIGAYVLVQKKPKGPGEPPLAVIKRLAKRSGNRVVLEQFNPAKTFELKSDEIVSMHRVVGSGEA